MVERLQKCVGGLQKIPSWLWRLLFSVGLGAMVYAMVVPWAQAQRDCASLGGEYVLVLVAVVLPQIIFRR